MSTMPSDNHSEPDPDSKRRVTLRDIAREVGVSHVTVSKALRNQSGASEKLKLRIRQKAEEMGYMPDPMLSALSHYRKTSKDKPIQSELAWLNTWTNPQQLREHKEFNLYREGAAYSAQQLGYHLEEFNLAEISTQRLGTIFKTRNIQGILLPPSSNKAMANVLKKFDWSNVAVVRFGHATLYPKMHYVTSAQMLNTIRAFKRVQELGYKRIGFVCEYWQDRYFSVGYSWAQKKLPKPLKLPELLLNTADNDEHQFKELKTWLHQNKPDAILTDKNEIPTMLKTLGYRIPEDIGLATTSIHDTAIDSGIDQRPYEIGRAAIRILTALIAEKSFGIPDCRNATLIEGRWVDAAMMPRREA